MTITFNFSDRDYNTGKAVIFTLLVTDLNIKNMETRTLTLLDSAISLCFEIVPRGAEKVMPREHAFNSVSGTLLNFS